MATSADPRPSRRQEAARQRRREAKAAARAYNGAYAGEHLSRVAFPLGGIGAGMICLEGTGALSHVSLRHQPDVFNEPCVFAAVCVKGDADRGPRARRARCRAGSCSACPDAGNGAGGTTFGLPRFRARALRGALPVRARSTLERRRAFRSKVEITGWSPFEPGDADSSSLPVAALEYRFTNPTQAAARGGLLLERHELHGRGEGRRKAVRADRRAASCSGAGGAEGQAVGRGRASPRRSTTRRSKVNHAWFRGGWFDRADHGLEGRRRRAPASTGRAVTEGGPSPGRARSSCRSRSRPGASKTIVLRLSWYVGTSQPARRQRPGGRRRPMRPSAATAPGTRGASPDIDEVTGYWRDALRRAARRRPRASRDCFYDTTLPPEVVEAVAANLTILKSPTVLRQADGRLWALGRLRRQLAAAATAPARTSGTTRRRCRTSSRAGADAARDGVRRLAGRRAGTRRSAPRCPSGPPSPRLPRRGRRPARRHHEGLPRVAHQRRHRVAARPLAERAARASTTASRPGTRGTPGRRRGAAPQHLRHRVLGPGRDVHELLPRRARRPRC